MLVSDTESSGILTNENSGRKTPKMPNIISRSRPMPLLPPLFVRTDMTLANADRAALYDRRQHYNRN